MPKNEKPEAVATDAKETADNANKIAQDANLVAREQNRSLCFTNGETAKHFESLVTIDRDVHKAGVYSGKLSNINLAMAEAMVEQNTNLIKAKQ